MVIIPQGSDQPLRGDLVFRVVLRTDLTPIPATVEIEARRSDEVSAALALGAVVKVGADLTPFSIIKVNDPRDEGLIRDDQQVGTIKAVGILESCAAVAKPLQRAVIREGASLGAIYRACGAGVRIASDFTVAAFSVFMGQVPSYGIAQVLQEEGGVLILTSSGIQFRRLDELRSSKATLTIDPKVAPLIESDFLERHVVPFAFSTSKTGAAVFGRSESGRRVVYRPRGSVAVLNNISTSLIQRRKLPYQFLPSVNAGTRIDVGTTPNIVITAAHAFDAGEQGAGGAYSSTFWLGEVVN